MKTIIAVMIALALPQCARDETLSAYGAADRTWVLVEIDGQQFSSRATVNFSSAGHIEGEGPCNAFSGRQTAPYPWFEVRELAVTRRACPALNAETKFLRALQNMTLAEVLGDTLILSNDQSSQMIFRSSD